MAEKNAMKVVGHRGWPEQYPENSLAGIEAALKAGADAVEFDVQVCSSGEPVVLHDADLLRVAGTGQQIADLTPIELSAVSVHEPSRFGKAFYPTPIPSLERMVDLLIRWPAAQVFLELKEEAFQTVDRETLVRRVLQIVQPLGQRCIIISFDLPVLRLVQSVSELAVGWVLTEYHESERQQLVDQPVEYLICNLHKVAEAEQTLWKGPWQWFMYDIVEPADLQRCQNLAVDYVETWDTRTLRKLLGTG